MWFQVIQRASCHQRHPRPPPAGTAPPSLVLLRHPRRRLGYPRACIGRHILSNSLRAIQPLTFANDFRREGQALKPRRCATRPETGRYVPREGRKLVIGTKPGRTEPILAPRQPRHGLARARPDSPSFRPLHSATRTALQATRTFRCIPTVANCRDRRERRALPRWKFRESGQLSFRCATRNSPPSLQITGNGLTPRSSGYAPCYVAPPVSLAALRPTLRWLAEESAQPALALARLARRTPATQN